MFFYKLATLVSAGIPVLFIHKTESATNTTCSNHQLSLNQSVKRLLDLYSIHINCSNFNIPISGTWSEGIGI